MKKLIIMLFALAIVLTLAACGSAEEENENKNTDTDIDIESTEILASSPENSSDTAADELEEPIVLPPAFTNPLTGEGTDIDISGNRPYVVMLNTIKQSLPQSGNSRADIYYEMVEEGGITRIMGVYQDISDVGILGSIRSTRSYYVQLTYALDGFLVHAGGSWEGLNEISNLGLKTINALGAAGGIFYRDQARLRAGFAMEHTMFVESDSLQDWITNSSGYRTKHEDGYLDNHSHTFAADGTPASGTPANVITVPFSGYKSTTFTYDEASGKYFISMFGSKYIDEQTSEQIGVTNVIVINTNIYTKENSRMSIAITGSGSGYYACGGKIIPINWSKANYSDIYTLTAEDGTEFPLGTGKTYVCVISTKNSITVE